MNNKTFLILGGYGGAGFPITRLLLQETEARIILAARNREKAERAADRLNTEFPGARVTWRYADAADPQSLTAALDGVDVLLVCSTTTQYAEQVARVALLAGLDYMDIYAAQKIIPILKSLEPAIKQAGRCFITQAGFHPGLLAPFIRYAASYFSQYQKALVAMVMNDRREVSLQVTTEIAEMIVASAAETYVFKDGRWRQPEADYTRKIDFGSEFGVRVCYPVWFEEIRALPEQCGLEEAGAYIAGFSSLDNLMLRLVELLNNLKQEAGTRFLAWLLWKLSPMSQPPFGVRFKLEAAGVKDGKAISLEMLAQHDDPYALTAICTVACLLQYLDGSIRRPGLWLMGHLVEPGRLLKDMERMGAKVSMEVKDGNN